MLLSPRCIFIKKIEVKSIFLGLKIGPIRMSKSPPAEWNSRPRHLV